MIQVLSPALSFPEVEHAHESGILAVGGDLSPERLTLAYQSGVFPWFNEGEPIVWWAPDPRMVLFLDELKVSKSMRNILNRELFQITMNQRFREVVTACKNSNRKGQDGTWITDEMVEAYCRLHEKGIARSVEVWQHGNLVGGLYGIDLGHVFCRESMFSKVSNASKVAFVHLCRSLKEKGYVLLDCQVYNEHLASLGAREIPRNEFMKLLRETK